MRLVSFQVQQYKSIADTGVIQAGNPITVLIGRNNVGKTAILECLYRAFQGGYSAPTMGIVAPNGIEQEDRSAYIDIEIELNNEEVDKDIPFLSNTYRSNSGKSLQLNFQARNNSVSLFNATLLSSDVGKHILFSINPNQKPKFADDVSPEFIPQIILYLKKSMLYIDSRRAVTDNIGLEMQSESLDSRASNLHAFFLNLHTNHEDQFDLLRREFVKMFPEVKSLRTLTTTSTTNIQLEFAEYNKLIPLQECGSGFTQALILLYTSLIAKDKIILFDEPHSNLHPHAEKALYDLVSTDDRNSYIFTTHSPILINHSSKKTLYIVRKKDGISKANELTSVQEAFDELGINNSDFAFADKVIFVEGPTEEKVFPIILEHHEVKQFGYNYKIISLNGKGSVICKPIKRNIEVFLTMFKSLAASPIPFRILLDNDTQESQVDNLKSAIKDNLIILDRYEIENYFLEPEAISEVLRSYNCSVTKEEITSELGKILSETTDKILYPRNTSESNKDVKGSIVLDRLFDKYGKVYDKIKDGEKLATRISQTNKEVFQTLVDPLRDLINS